LNFFGVALLFEQTLDLGILLKQIKSPLQSLSLLLLWILFEHSQGKYFGLHVGFQIRLFFILEFVLDLLVLGIAIFLNLQFFSESSDLIALLSEYFLHGEYTRLQFLLQCLLLFARLICLK